MLKYSMEYGEICRKMLILIIFALLPAQMAAAAQSTSIFTFEKPGGYKPANQIDEIISSTLLNKGGKPANLCSDPVFIRRVYLDVIGTIPTEQEVRKFLENPHQNKRSTLINMILERPEYADYWSLKWCDLLRVKSEFPINLWPNAVQAYHHWIQDCLSKNMAYDQFARELLTTSGSNFRYPQVNFYRAMQGHEPSAIANAVALNFMGMRLEKWPEDKRKGIEAFFSRLAYKGTAEWKEEIVYLDPTPTDKLKTVLPNGKEIKIQPGQDPRMVFADWLISDDNDYFASNIVNRIWAWLFGRGIIEPADDIGPHNKAAYPEVLTLLEKELVKSNYNLKDIFRLILNSSTYQQSSIPKPGLKNPEQFFACYPVRQLDAEVLVDAICMITGTNERYSSLIPEPFTFIPAENRSIELADGSITSTLLEMFGRPSRDSGYESERVRIPTERQRLHMLNSAHIQQKIERSRRLKRLLNNPQKKKNNNIISGNQRTINVVYLSVLSRYPTKQEIQLAEDYFKAPGIGNYRGAIDLVWALLNSKEFMFRH